MKIRNGFVSNSSSSSFCLGKYFLTDEQIKEFSYQLDDLNEGNYGEGYIDEDKNYFMGTVSYHNEKLDEIIDEMGIRDFVGYGE